VNDTEGYCYDVGSEFLDSGLVAGNCPYTIDYFVKNGRLTPLGNAQSPGRGTAVFFVVVRVTRWDSIPDGSERRSQRDVV
jgi:hypothetical protein